MKIKDSLRSAIWNQEDDSFLFKDPRMPKVGSDESKNNEPDSSSPRSIREEVSHQFSTDLPGSDKSSNNNSDFSLEDSGNEDDGKPIEWIEVSDSSSDPETAPPPKSKSNNIAHPPPPDSDDDESITDFSSSEDEIIHEKNASKDKTTLKEIFMISKELIIDIPPTTKDVPAKEFFRPVDALVEDFYRHPILFVINHIPSSGETPRNVDRRMIISEAVRWNQKKLLETTEFHKNGCYVDVLDPVEEEDIKDIGSKIRAN